MDLQHNYITDRGIISFMDNLYKISDNPKKKKDSNVMNIEKNQIINDTETIINLEYNYINFASCRERIKLFNTNSKINYIIYARNQHIN